MADNKMKQFIAVFFCFISVSTFSQCNTKNEEVINMDKWNSNNNYIVTVDVIPCPLHRSNSVFDNALQQCVSVCIIDRPKQYPPVGMYVRHYFGISYWY